jgi:hypothetical protein
MKIKYRHLSVPTLALFVCLVFAPFVGAAEASRDRDRSIDIPHAIARTIKKLKQVLHGITTFDDVPSPPKP